MFGWKIGIFIFLILLLILLSAYTYNQSKIRYPRSVLLHVKRLIEDAKHLLDERGEQNTLGSYRRICSAITHVEDALNQMKPEDISAYTHIVPEGLLDSLKEEQNRLEQILSPQ
jgi:hypothetical protein